jgi:hypothetical protein
MATGTLQTSGDVTAQLEQMITTLGATAVSDGKTGLLKQLNAALAAYNAAGSALPIGPSGVVGESIPRSLAAGSVTIATVSGTIYMDAVYLPANTVVNNVNEVTGTTASSNDVTINWGALCDNTRKVLAVSANATAQLTPAGFVDTLALTSAFTTTYSGLYYIAFTVGATTTQPTLYGVTAAGTGLAVIVPILCGTSSTAGTSTPPTAGTVLGAITGTTNHRYAYLT